MPNPDKSTKPDSPLDAESQLVRSVVELLRKGADVGAIQELVNKAVDSATFETNYDANAMLRLVASKKQPLSIDDDFNFLTSTERLAYKALKTLTFVSGENSEGTYIDFKGSDGLLYRAPVSSDELDQIEVHSAFSRIPADNRTAQAAFQLLKTTAINRQRFENKSEMGIVVDATARKFGL